jgi:hypothetical protein
MKPRGRRPAVADEQEVRVGEFVWWWHESVGWYNDSDDPAWTTETAMLDEIKRLRAEVERLQEWCDILANDHCECEPDMAAKGFACPYCHYRGQRGTR